MKSGLRVVDAMNVRPVVASPSMTIREVAAMMDRHQVGSVLIKDGTELIGIVTERDFVRRAVLEGYNMFTTPISMMTTKDIITISPGMDLFDVLLLMKDMDVKYLPVLDDGELVGFITAKDILRLQPQLYETFVDSYEMRTKRSREHRTAVIDIDEFERML